MAEHEGLKSAPESIKRAKETMQTIKEVFTTDVNGQFTSKNPDAREWRQDLAGARHKTGWEEMDRAERYDKLHAGLTEMSWTLEVEDIPKLAIDFLNEESRQLNAELAADYAAQARD